MITKELRTVFLGKSQIKPAIAKFCRAIEMLDELCGDFDLADFEGYCDPNDLERLTKWIADIHNADPDAAVTIEVVSA
jgi:hypothetical protein